MTFSQVSLVDQINKTLKSELKSSPEFYTKALEVARSSGAFKDSNVVFFRQQLCKINPKNPQHSLDQLKMISLQRAG